MDKDGMEIRAIAAVVLSLLVLLLYQYFFAASKPKLAKDQAQRIESIARRAPAGTEQGGKAAQGESLEQKQAPAGVEGPVKPLKIVEAKQIDVSTKRLNLTISNQGAIIRRVVLKDYTDDKGRPLDLIPSSAGVLNPPILEFPDAALTERVNSSNYSYSAESVNTSSRDPSEEISFQYLDGSGTKVTKRFTFYDDLYRVDLKIQVDQDGPERSGWWRVLWGPGLNMDSSSDSIGAVLFINGKREAISPDKIDHPQKQQGMLYWAGLENKYFIAALIPRQNFNTAVVQKGQGNSVWAGLESTASDFGLAKDLSIYIGPKDYDLLKAQGVYLEKSIDYGWFSFLASPLLRVLKFFYGFTKNYGIAIILLTVIIKIIFYPLTHKSIKSMQKMQMLQPKLKEMQQRYKNDKQKLNQEMMVIYRQNKINPIGGCLPMVLQIPVFIALYNVLMQDISLRHAPFVLWITDLSAKDPYYISPLLMGASMFWQQKMTPMMGDPTQAKLMMFMPVIFTVMFLNFPVGLVIYWLVNNVLTIGQQYVINRSIYKKQS